MRGPPFVVSGANDEGAGTVLGQSKLFQGDECYTAAKQFLRLCGARC